MSDEEDRYYVVPERQEISAYREEGMACISQGEHVIKIPEDDLDQLVQILVWLQGDIAK
ncbi:hypothetical protein [Oceanidesulfovibrio marinus]|uniref:hypothetical protein n=1 Tax=Oceanidesulfovibrio marinus TaxID=370038 RepID=UPI00129483D0|nr:hypothetical protein [Oceanidesulfovibrio marinus]